MHTDISTQLEDNVRTAPLTITLPPMCALDPEGLKGLHTALEKIYHWIPDIMENNEAMIVFQYLFDCQIKRLEEYYESGWGEKISD